MVLSQPAIGWGSAATPPGSKKSRRHQLFDGLGFQEPEESLVAMSGEAEASSKTQPACVCGGEGGGYSRESGLGPHGSCGGGRSPGTNPSIPRAFCPSCPLLSRCGKPP